MPVTEQLNELAGIGLRATHYRAFLNGRPPVGWLEVHSENYFGDGGYDLHVLEHVRRDYPVSLHGVGLSLGSADGLRERHLAKLERLVTRFEPLLVSEHLCWSTYGERHFNDLLPLPYTEQALALMAERVDQVQSKLGRQILIENVSSYIEFSDSACSEWQFLSHVAQEADCLLLLDVNNVYVSSVNHRFDPAIYLKAMPVHRIQQIHLAGHTRQPDVIIDTHDHPVCSEVWQLYAQACDLFGPVATMIERDDHIPPLAELIEELQIARDISAGHVDDASPQIESQQPVLVWDLKPSNCGLSEIQKDWTASVLAETLTDEAPILPNLAPGHRFGVYHHAYASRLAEALADTYDKTMLYMGSTLFETHAREHARRHPPRAANLNDYAPDFPKTLALAYPEHPELFELATLEWHLHAVFASSDEPALTPSDLAADTDLNWLHRSHPLRGHARLMTVTRSVPEIWHAIQRDEEVPGVETLGTPTDILVWRKGEQPHFLSLIGTEAELIRLMLAGHSIAQACEQAEDQSRVGDGGFLQDCLGRWLGLDLLAGPEPLAIRGAMPSRHGPG